MVRIRILTNSGWKYEGEKISEDSNFIELIDAKEGKIKIPLSTISFIKEVGE